MFVVMHLPGWRSSNDDLLGEKGPPNSVGPHLPTNMA